MEVLLVHPHTYHSDIANRRLPDTLPIGLGIVQRILKDAGHTVSVLDVQGRDMSHGEVEAALAARRDRPPAFVGVSAMSTQYAYVKWFSARVREAFGPSTRIVLGGCLAKFSYDVVLANTDVDICFMGDAERYLLPFVEADRPEEASGIARRDGDAIVVNTADSQEPETCDVVPDYSGMPVQTYMGIASMWSILSGRGCAFDCDFCSRQFEHLTFRSIGSMREELDECAGGYSYSSILVADEYALATRRRAEEIAGLLNGYGRWSANGRVNTVTPEMLASLRSQGCSTVSYGVESGSQRILDRMRKKTTVAQIEQAIRWTAEAGMRPNPQLIFGYVGENDETIRETMELLGRLRDVWLTSGVSLGFAFATPLPGSALYDWCFETGKLSEEAEEEYLLSLEGGFNKPRLNLTEWTVEEFLGAYERCMAEIRSY